jgi:CHRD domain/PEP-CTERM motif
MRIRLARSLACAAAMIGILVAAPMAFAATINFTISMNGAQETPPNLSPAAGGGIAQYDTVANTISVSAFFAGLAAPANASHIHVGAAGVPGAIIVSFVPFTPAATSGSIVGGPLPFPAANIADLMAGHTYFNIHDSVFPNGEIRGQLIPIVVPEPSTFLLVGLGTLGIAGARRRSIGER